MNRVQPLMYGIIRPALKPILICSCPLLVLNGVVRIIFLIHEFRNAIRVNIIVIINMLFFLKRFLFFQVSMLLNYSAFSCSFFHGI